MKHVILAAGMGTRLFPITLETPKVLLNVGSTTLLGHQIENSLRAKDIHEIMVVAGYKNQAIEEYLRKNFGAEASISTAFNPDFRINNPIYSIKVAMPTVESDDFLITNGDVYYTHSLLRRLIAQEEGVTMVISPYRDQTERAMSAHVSNGRMVAIHPHPPENDSYESPGLVVVKGEEARNVFYHSTARLYKRYLGETHYWHDILNEVKLEVPIKTIMIDSETWGEVDNKEDLISVDRLSRKLYED